MTFLKVSGPFEPRDPWTFSTSLLWLLRHWHSFSFTLFIGYLDASSLNISRRMVSDRYWFLLVFFIPLESTV